MRVLVCITDKQVVLLCRPNITRRNVVETEKFKKCRTWYNLFFLQRLGHSGISSAVKLPRVSSDAIVACHVKRNKMQNFLNTARINLIVGNRSKFKTDLY